MRPVYCLCYKLSSDSHWVTMLLKYVFFFVISQASVESKFASTVSSGEDGTRPERSPYVITTTYPNGTELHKRIVTMGSLVAFIVIVTVVFMLCQNELHRRKKRRLEMSLSLTVTQMG